MTWPSEEVIRWSKTLGTPTQNKSISILDIGCGVGRHILYLREQGFAACGCETSETALSALKMEIIAHFKGGLPSLVVDSASFDHILCYSVLHYLTPENIEPSFKEMYRILRPGGKAFILTRTKSDGRNNGLEKELELPLTFLGADEVYKLIFDTGFEVEELGRKTVDGKGRLDDDWLIYVRKP